MDLRRGGGGAGGAAERGAPRHGPNGLAGHRSDETVPGHEPVLMLRNCHPWESDFSSELELPPSWESEFI